MWGRMVHHQEPKIDIPIRVFHYLLCAMWQRKTRRRRIRLKNSHPTQNRGSTATIMTGLTGLLGSRVDGFPETPGWLTANRGFPLFACVLPRNLV